ADSTAYELGRVPYTLAFFAALGTAVAQWVFKRADAPSAHAGAFEALISELHDAEAIRERISRDSANRGDTPVAYVAPRDPREEILARIWSTVLHLERVGVHDDFFALGGSSLSAIQVLVALREAFSVSLPLSRFIDAPTIAGLAAAVSGGAIEAPFPM